MSGFGVERTPHQSVGRDGRRTLYRSGFLTTSRPTGCPRSWPEWRLSTATHTCRRKGCGHVERTGPDDGMQRRCPRCSDKLYLYTEIRNDLTFHATRHTTASVLAERGVHLSRSRLPAPHGSEDDSDLHASRAGTPRAGTAELLWFQSAHRGVRQGGQAEKFDPPVIHGHAAADSARKALSKKAALSRVCLGRGERIRTSDILLPSPSEGIAPDGSGLQAAATIREGSLASSQRSQPLAPNSPLRISVIVNTAIGSS